MAEATIDLARGGETGEETRTVDLSALIGSLCDDLSEIGQEVSFEGAGRLLLRCRPTSIRRALRNVIENAGRYGTNPRLHLLRDGMSVRIEVLDDGPGIVEEMLEQVFAPFFRLETSRCRSTGGSGLGLAIARTIIRHHGGDITLQNRHPGLCAAITLPLTPAALPEPAKDMAPAAVSTRAASPLAKRSLRQSARPSAGG